MRLTKHNPSRPLEELIPPDHRPNWNLYTDWYNSINWDVLDQGKELKFYLVGKVWRWSLTKQDQVYTIADHSQAISRIYEHKHRSLMLMTHRLFGLEAKPILYPVELCPVKLYLPLWGGMVRGKISGIKVLRWAKDADDGLTYEARLHQYLTNPQIKEIAQYGVTDSLIDWLFSIGEYNTGIEFVSEEEWSTEEYFITNSVVEEYYAYLTKDNGND